VELKKYQRFVEACPNTWRAWTIEVDKGKEERNASDKTP
jgi:hypothetical protein